MRNTQKCSIELQFAPQLSAVKQVLITDRVLVRCMVHVTKLVSKRSDPISLHQNHKQELWSANQSYFFEGCNKWFQETFKDQTNISSDIYFDSRNNLANSGYTGLECSPVINGDAWPQKPFMINFVEESVLVCWLLGSHISFVFVFFSVILFVCLLV